MSEIISFKPGQILAIEVGSLSGRPTYAEFPYDDLMRMLVGKYYKGHGTSRRSKTPEAKASRQIALLCRALATGTWSTGAPVDKEVIKDKLRKLVSEVNVDNLTPKARETLWQIQKDGLV